jgi:integrase
MLTEASVRALRPKDRPYKRSDGQGLYVLVTVTGARLWRFKYRFNGKEKLLTVGAWPEVSLKEAREKRDDARKQLRDGIDPHANKQAAKIAAAADPLESFEDVAQEYYGRHARTLSEATRVRDRRILRKVYAGLGARPIVEIETPEILAALRSIESAGTYETAHRALGLTRRVYAYAVATGKVTRDATSGLQKALEPVVASNRAAITKPKQLGALLRAIDAYQGQPATIAALQLLPRLFTRPGELRLAQWHEFDLDGGQWVVPASRMKSRSEHLVPLSRQTVRILSNLHDLTGAGAYVFPSLRPGRPLSENTLNVALRNMGYDGATHVGHGFRATASTLLHELGWDSQLIELQLAHSDRNKVRAAYNRAERLADRKNLMQAWSDYLDGLRADNTANVRALRG